MRRLAILAAAAAALACSAEKSPPPPAPAAAPAPARQEPPAAALAAAPAAAAVPAPATAAFPAPATAPAAVPAPAPAPARVRPAASPTAPPQVPQPGVHARLGPDRCKGCHKVQHASWAGSEHAKKGLDCESCHGNGADYYKVMKDREKSLAGGLVMPDLSFCKRCHAKADAALLPKAHAHKP